MKKIALQNLGKNMKCFRKLSGKSQREMADSLDISESYYQKLETGNASPSVDILIAASLVLSVPVDCLLKDEGIKMHTAYADSFFYDAITHYTDDEFQFYSKVLFDLYTQIKSAKTST